MAEGDLTTLAKAKSWLGITDSSQDAVIRTQITVASQMIVAYLSHPVIASEFDEFYDGNDKAILVPRYSPVLSVSSIEVDDVEIPATAITFTPTMIRLKARTFRRGTQNVRVAYTAGYDPVPTVVEQAVLFTIQGLRSSQSIDPNITSESVPGTYSANYRQEGAGVVPQSARTILADYVRRIW